jgi:murein DD-endopeptidase MepM/ murein hydrolase activator NlpD
LNVRHTDTTRRPAERLSILIVPRNKAGIRRIDASGRLIRIALGGLVALVLLLCTSIGAMFYYRHIYLGTEGLRAEAAQFLQERSALMGRLAELEAAIGRTERFAAKVEASNSKGRGEQVGQGPVEESDALPVSPPAAPVRLGEGMWKSPFSKSLTAGLDLSLKRLSERNDVVEEKLHTAFSNRQERLFFRASLPSSWPTHGIITSEFGDGRGSRRHARMHEGVDIAGPVGTPISAPGDGVVTFSGYRAGYGRAIIIDHGSGLSTLYGHCSAVYVAEGQHVQRGTMIAAIGNTGRSTGPHLHYEVHVDGVPVNPLKYLGSGRKG